jgi:hypothetical protein
VRTSRLDRLAALVIVVTLGTLIGSSARTDAAFVVPTSNPANSFSAHPDWRPPTVARAAVVKAEGGIPGFVRAGGSYTVVASVADDPSSKPASGVGAVRSDVSALTAGATALPLPASASTVGGQTYTHRSAATAVAAGRAATTYSGSVTASDAATPVNTAAAFPFAVEVDNIAPTRTSATIANGGVPGRIDAGDTITYAWSEIIDPTSVLTGWDGTAIDVTVQVVNQNGGVGDNINIRNAANTADLQLGNLEMRIRDYVTGVTLFGGPANGTRSRMAWNATTGTVVVTLGPPDTPGTVTQNGTQTSSYIWRPDVVFDRAGNLSNTTAYTEPGGADRDW